MQAANIGNILQAGNHLSLIKQYYQSLCLIKFDRRTPLCIWNEKSRVLEKHQLSKSSFIKSVQCLKSLYLYKNHYALKDPVSKERQAVFNRGNNIGVLARNLFPGGVDVSPESVAKYGESVARTRELIEAGVTVIYEAAFIYEGVLVALDILVKKDNKWLAYEVKSSARISSVYVMDACLQYYVIRNVLPELEDIFIVNINPGYVLNGELKLESLFKMTSVKTDALKNLPFFEDRIARAREVLNMNTMPDVAISEHCFSPYPCDFIGTCWKKIPENSVFELSGISKSRQCEWYKRGYEKISDLPDDVEAGDFVKLQIQAFKKGTALIKSREIRDFYSKISFPVCFLDIEVAMPVVPLYEGTQPFQQIPFLFSVHELSGYGGIARHSAFIGEVYEDPRKAFARELIESTGNCGTVLVFDEQLEKTVIHRLAKDFPEYKTALEILSAKIIDFAYPFQQQWYYNPEMKGSFSLKTIFPALCQDQSFGQLTINSGVQAMYAWLEILEEKDLFRTQEIKEHLLKYCETDTYALMKVFEKLIEDCGW